MQRNLMLALADVGPDVVSLLLGKLPTSVVDVCNYNKAMQHLYVLHLGSACNMMCILFTVLLCQNLLHDSRS